MNKERSSQKGIIFMVIAVLLLPGSDSIVKILLESFPPIQIAWFRFTLQASFVLIIAIILKQKIGLYIFKFKEIK